jgi:hypothetical protein
MKKLIPLILIIVLISSGCEYSKLQVPVDINVNKTFTVDQTGAYSESSQITYSEVFGALDIPSNATIDAVNIESISVKVVVLPNNRATAVKISGNLQLGNSKPEVFKDYYAPLVGVNLEYVGLNSLIADGVSGLKTKIEGYLKSQDFSSFSINVNGNSSPTEGQRVNIQILLKITGTAKYTICAYMPFFVGGENCTPPM